MKKLLSPIAVLLIAAVSVSCTATKETKVKTKEETTTVTTTETTTETNTAPPQDTIVVKQPVKDADLYSRATTDPFTLLGAKVNGRYLDVEVEYGGGCGNADFDLVWNGALMKSMPPKVSMMLVFKDEDYCKALVKKTLRFDLQSVHDGETDIMLKDFRGVLKYEPR
jgi:hypothetical protein